MKKYQKVSVRAVEYFIEQNDKNKVWDYISQNELPWDEGAKNLAEAFLSKIDDFGVKVSDGTWYAWLPDYSSFTSVTNGEEMLSEEEALEIIERSCEIYLKDNEDATE